MRRAFFCFLWHRPDPLVSHWPCYVPDTCTRVSSKGRARELRNTPFRSREDAFHPTHNDTHDLAFFSLNPIFAMHDLTAERGVPPCWSDLTCARTDRKLIMVGASFDLEGSVVFHALLLLGAIAPLLSAY